jgi:carbon-monoxide dehydrogenase large subunit
VIVSWEDDFLVDFGVYNFSRFGVVGNTAIHLLGPYKIPAVRISGIGVYTNKAPTSQYRGAGRPEAAFALERSLDAAARRLGIGAFKLREINMLDATDLPYPQSLPYRDGSPIVYDGKNYRAVLEAARTLIPEDEFAELKRAEQRPNIRVGMGLAAHMEATGRGPEPETVLVTLSPDGDLVVQTGIGVSGQSHATVFTQVVADAAKVDAHRVRVITGDTQGVPRSLASIASRSAVVAGSAASIGAERLVTQLQDGIRQALQVSDVRHVPGGFEVDGGRIVGWDDLGQWVSHEGRLAGSGCDSAVGSFIPAAPTWLMAVHVVAVAVDLDTGKVQTLLYGVAHENGQALNPRVFDGQIRGGVAQGIGGALLEEVSYDENGQPTSANLADYLVPTAGDVPEIRLAHRDAASHLNPLGIRGIGESGLIASNAAIASAVDAALEEHDFHTDLTPITYDVVLSRLMGGDA